MNNRYLSLNKAPFTPPSYVFGIVWPILYTLMGISTYLIWSDPKCSPYCSALTFFFIQLFFNLIWTTLFFKWNMYKTALLDIVIWEVEILMEIGKDFPCRLFEYIIFMIKRSRNDVYFSAI